MKQSITKEVTTEKIRFTGSKLLFILLLIIWPIAILYFITHCETTYETKQASEEISDEDLIMELKQK